jgi:hypothetical protein
VSKLYTAVSQKGLTKNLYTAALKATTTFLFTLLAASASATDDQSVPPVTSTTAAATATVSLDASIFTGCSIQELNLSNREDWANKNSYDSFKQNMTIKKMKEVEQKIREQGAQNYYMNDPTAKKDVDEQITLRMEIGKIQGEVYKCLHSNVSKIPVADLKATRHKTDIEVVTSYPVKVLALQMALKNKMAELMSNVNNYSKDCEVKNPTNELYDKSSDCDGKFNRSHSAQILLPTYAQMRANLGEFADGDDRIFQKVLDANAGTLATLEKMRELQKSEPDTNTKAVATTPAKPALQ